MEVKSGVHIEWGREWYHFANELARGMLFVSWTSLAVELNTGPVCVHEELIVKSHHCKLILYVACRY